LPHQVQCCFRGYIGRLYYAYILSHWKAAIEIQRAIRYFLSRATTKLLKLGTWAKRLADAQACAER